MIIAAYAGTGKSTFAARIPNAVDLAIMPRSWILPPPGSEERNEREKGRLDRLPDPFFPDNYLLDILKAEREYDYVLIPTNAYVISQLRMEYGRKLVVCHPARDLKEEYRERFLKRGNSEEFLSLFLEQWDRMLIPVQIENVVPIVMQSGEYLTDLKERLDQELLSDDTEPVPDKMLEELEQVMESQRHKYVLQIGGDFHFRYQITDIMDPEERYFLAEVARKVHEDLPDMSIEITHALPIDKYLSKDVVTDDRVKVLNFLEEQIVKQ